MSPPEAVTCLRGRITSSSLIFVFSLVERERSGAAVGVHPQLVCVPSKPQRPTAVRVGIPGSISPGANSSTRVLGAGHDRGKHQGLPYKEPELLLWSWMWWPSVHSI